ncbi:MAG: AraC family transcriptional regulator [Candidatus Ratteibacteria bacterium]|nr:AraC family transcriptional regulator [Candidatus Ratteibacteria bacterium]
MRPVYENLFRDKNYKNSVMCLWNPPQIYQGNLAYHQEYEIHFIKRGSGSYFIKNRKYQFSHNNLIVIRSEEIHMFIPSMPPVYVEKGSLYLSPAFINKNKKIKDVVDACPRIIKLGEKEATRIEIIFRSIISEIDKKDTGWEEIISYEIMLFILLLKRCSLKKSSVPEHNPRIESIMEYIEKHFSEDISLSDIAKNFFLSESYLSHLFKNETGMSLKQYILQRRIIEAKKLLIESPDEKVHTIARKVGFTDFALFNRAFKKITGTTPSNYRITLNSR